MKKYLAVAVIMTALSCTNTDRKATVAADSTVKADTLAVNDVKLKDTKVQDIYNGYIALKNALTETKLDAAKSAAATLKVSLAAYKGCENTALIADKIATAKDIAGQRKEFTALSSDVIAMFKHADIEKGAIYVQHCPMANNGDGGDWLSSDKKIRNPYYGDEMMECGAVLEEIKASK